MRNLREMFYETFIVLGESMLIWDKSYSILHISQFSGTEAIRFFKAFYGRHGRKFSTLFLFVFSSYPPLFTPAHDCSNLYDHQILNDTLHLFPRSVDAPLNIRVCIHVKPCQEFQSLQSNIFNFNQSVRREF